LKLIPFISCLLLSGSSVWNKSAAQVTGSDVITTDSVDIFSVQPEKEKSPWLAMASSLFLPGSGHQYLGRDRSALVYFTADALTIFGLIFCGHYAKKLALDAAGYAWLHAGAHGTINSADDYYWKQVGEFMSIQDYNTAQDLNRSPQNKFTDENQAWHWDDEATQKRFNAIMSSSRSFHVASSFCIGALVLDRIIAFIDVRASTRNRGTKQSGRTAYFLQPFVTISPSSMDLQFSAAF
jgi:hypothetical protein